MILAATTPEIKKWISVTTNFDAENLDPPSLAVKKFIVDILGDDEFNLLVTNYDSNALTAEQEALLPYVQNAYVNLAMHHYIGNGGQLEISNAGVNINVTVDKKTAWEWQIKEHKAGLKTTGFNAIEELLYFLWSSPAGTYLLWRASAQKNKHLNLFCNSAKQFSEAYNIKENYALFRELKDTIAFVEMQYIVPVIQTAVANDLHNKIKNFSTSAIEDKLIEKITAALANKTIVHAIPKLASVFDELGIFENFTSMNMSVNSTNPVRDTGLSLRIREADKVGEKYLVDLARFIKDNALSFPLYVPDTSTPVQINTIENGFYTIL